MLVNNIQRNALRSTISLPALARAMAQLDLSSVPPEKRRAAVMDHFMRIQAATIFDRNLAEEITASRNLRRARNISSPYRIKSPAKDK